MIMGEEYGATFYEVFPISQITDPKDRILRNTRTDEFTEMQVALGGFYDKISQ